MKFLVISDIHAMSDEIRDRQGYSGPTGGKISVENRLITNNQLLGIKPALKGEKIDYILNLGDMAHQAKKLVTYAVWRDICDVAEYLKIEKIVSTSGNHDVASRPEEFEQALPSRFLREINPPFPLKHETRKGDYERDGISIWEDHGFRFILIDTCTLHGYGGENAGSVFDRGHVSEHMLERIEQSVRADNTLPNLVVMHHHPQRVDAIADNGNDKTENGDRLVGIFSDQKSPTLIVHGHKHLVRLFKYGAEAWGPYIFSASSLAANAYQNMDIEFSNQFHIIDIEYEGATRRVRGEVRSWDWVATKWSQARNPRMPARVGFGRTRQIADIARDITSIVSPGGSLVGKQALDQIDDLQYCTKDDVDSLVQILQSNHKVKSGLTSDGGFSFWKEK